MPFLFQHLTRGLAFTLVQHVPLQLAIPDELAKVVLGFCR